LYDEYYSILEEGMKKIIFSMLVLTLMITACAGATTSAPVATQAATENVGATTTSAPVATQAATESVSATTASDNTAQLAQSAGGKVQVQVTEGDNWIKSDMATFKVGVPYVFTITNTGNRAHIFSISQPVPDKSASGIDAAKNGALVLVSQDQLSPGATVTVEYTFTKPAPAGSLEFACLIFMHYKMGQVLPIVVE